MPFVVRHTSSILEPSPVCISLLFFGPCKGFMAAMGRFSIGKTGVQGGRTTMGLHSTSLDSQLCLQVSEEGAVHCALFSLLC